MTHKAKHILLTIMAMLSTSFAWASEPADLTDQYLQNASFEEDDASKLQAVNNSADGLRGYTLNAPSKWTVEGTPVTQLLVDASCFTDNNFGKVTSIYDGKYAYYLRMGWSTGSTTLTQTVKLPAGKYELEVRHRSAYVNGASSSLRVFAGNDQASYSFQQGTTGCFTSMLWDVSAVEFTVAEETEVNIGFTITWQSGGSCIMLDCVRLLDMSNLPEELDPTEDCIYSPTEGTINGEFVGETEMKSDLLQMLANFSTYMVNDWNQCQAPNSLNESCGFFKGENSGGSDERGVRPNADLSMICAFLIKYGKPANVKLPSGVTWDKIEEMAMKSLIFAYSTHKANKLKVCSGGKYWGSTSTSDAVWESSLWAMSVAYSAYFQWEKLSEAQKGYIYALLKAECNYELNRSIPTGYNGDTKAEENGWEADILAATLGLFPDDALAPKWFARLREFAINSYSHPSDATNKTVIDPDYDNVTVANLYKGQNLYDDYTLQNHNLFHTSYQNVVMQELGEAALALKMFQKGLHGTEKWKTNALMHHNQEVQDSVLNWLALADGELAMPNGNDWSLFLYDQITSYSTQACFQRDANALMLENMAYKYIKARQKTTSDGSWLLRADVGARRMGVEAHRVMMTYLMHEMLSTDDLQPTAWDDFRNAHSEARTLPCQNVVRAYTPSRFTTFSWSTGLKSYTGYFASDTPDKNKIVVPYRANNTGNLTGWYEVSGKGTNATPVVSGKYQMKGNSYVMNGELNVNDATLNNRFAIYSTPGNAIIYLDHVTGAASGTITAEKGGMLAISTDELTKVSRTLYFEGTDGSIIHKLTDGSAMLTFETDWMNIDNEVGVVGANGKSMAFGDRSLNNSIYTSKLYPMYNAKSRSFTSNSVVDTRSLIYYNNVSAATTQQLSEMAIYLKDLMPKGWNGVIASDPNLMRYLLLSNFKGTTTKCTLSNLVVGMMAPVFEVETTISDCTATATFTLSRNNSYAQPLQFFATCEEAKAKLTSPTSATVTLDKKGSLCVNIYDDEGTLHTGQFDLNAGTYQVWLEDGSVKCEGDGTDPSTGLLNMPNQTVQDNVETYDLSGRRIAKNSHRNASHELLIKAGKKYASMK